MGDEHLALPARQGGVDDVLELAAAFALVVTAAVPEHPPRQFGHAQRRAYEGRRQQNVRVVRHGRHGVRTPRPPHPAG